MFDSITAAQDSMLSTVAPMQGVQLGMALESRLMIATTLFATQQLVLMLNHSVSYVKARSTINNADASLPAECCDVATPQARLCQKTTLGLTQAFACCQKQHWQINALQK